MSWLDESFETEIETGDGQIFVVNTREIPMKREERTTTFARVGGNGDFVQRRGSGGRDLSLVLYFGGEKHHEEAATFEDATIDPNDWWVTLPYRSARIRVQLLSIERTDDLVGGLNGSAVTVSLHETGPLGETGKPKGSVGAESMGTIADQLPSISYPDPKLARRELSAVAEFLESMMESVLSTGSHVVDSFSVVAESASVHATEVALATRAAVSAVKENGAMASAMILSAVSVPYAAVMKGIDVVDSVYEISLKIRELIGSLTPEVTAVVAISAVSGSVQVVDSLTPDTVRRTPRRKLWKLKFELDAMSKVAIESLEEIETVNPELYRAVLAASVEVESSLNALLSSAQITRYYTTRRPWDV